MSRRRWSTPSAAPNAFTAAGVPVSGSGSNLATHARHSALRCSSVKQGLTLVHFSAQRKRFLRDKGCV